MEELKKDLTKWKVATNNELENGIKNDVNFQKALQNLDFSNEEKVHFKNDLLAYYESFKTCEKCKGLKTCKSFSYGMQKIIQRIDDYPTLVIDYCPFYKSVKGMEDSFLIYDFPQEWFENKNPETDHLKKLLRAILSFFKGDKYFFYLQASNLEEVEHPLAFLVGKINLKGTKRAAFINTPNRVNELRNLTFERNNHSSSILKTLQDVDTLILTSFGEEYKTDYTRDSIIVPLIKSRMKEGKKTIFISTMPLNQIHTLYQTSNRGSFLMAKNLEETIKNNAEEYVQTSSPESYL